MHVNHAISDLSVHDREIKAANRADRSVVLDTSTPRHRVALVGVDTNEPDSSLEQWTFDHFEIVYEHATINGADAHGEHCISEGWAQPPEEPVTILGVPSFCHDVPPPNASIHTPRRLGFNGLRQRLRKLDDGPIQRGMVRQSEQESDLTGRQLISFREAKSR